MNKDHANTEIVFDTIIIGGGAAGLTAATVLGRSLRQVLLIDAGDQSNKAASKSHTVFSRDGESPQNLYEAARKDLEKYTSVITKSAQISCAEKISDIFQVTTGSNEFFKSRSLLLAQGTKYELPTLRGLQPLWGNKAWHCPYCHGFEAKNKKLFIYGKSAWIEYLSVLMPQWSKDLTWSSADGLLPTETIEKIEKAGGKVVSQAIEVMDTKDGVTVVLDNGEKLNADQIVIEITQRPRDDISRTLGSETTDFGRTVVDDSGASSTVEGLYIAGDQSDMHAQVNIAVASGHKTAMSINTFLCKIDRDSE